MLRRWACQKSRAMMTRWFPSSFFPPELGPSDRNPTCRSICLSPVFFRRFLLNIDSDGLQIVDSLLLWSFQVPTCNTPSRQSKICTVPSFPRNRKSRAFFLVSSPAFDLGIKLANGGDSGCWSQQVSLSPHSCQQHAKNKFQDTRART